MILSGSWYSRWEDKIDEEEVERIDEAREEKKRRNTEEVSCLIYIRLH